MQTMSVPKRCNYYTPELHGDIWPSVELFFLGGKIVVGREPHVLGMFLFVPTGQCASRYESCWA